MARIKKMNHYVDRLTYGNIRNDVKLTNLIDIQTKPYDWFLKEGIKKIFEEFFPIVRNDGNAILNMNSWRIQDTTMSVNQVREESKIYDFSIYADMTIQIKSVNNIISKTNIISKEVDLIKSYIEMHMGHAMSLKRNNKKDFYHFYHKTNDGTTVNIFVEVKKRRSKEIFVDYDIDRSGQVFFGNFPKMTEKGTFIINGSEKVVVSQLVRAPGAYFKSEFNSKSRDDVFNFDIIPNRGTWLEFITNIKKNLYNNNKEISKVLYVKIDKTRKATLTNLLLSLGLSKEHVKFLYSNHPYIKNTFNLDNLVGDFEQDQKNAVHQIYKKIRSGEIATTQGAQRFLYSLFFNERKYDLTPTGRYKLTQKLNIKNRLLNRILAGDIKDSKGKVLLKDKTVLNAQNLDKLDKILKKGYLDVEVKASSLIEGCNIVEKISIYKNNILEEIDKNSKVISLIGNKPNIPNLTITLSDIIASISYLLNLDNQIGSLDDIDFLGNRYVKTVGRLVKDQFRIGMLRIEKNVKEKLSTLNSFKITPTNIINNKPLTSIIGEFFNLSQLCQFMDQTNPLSELTNKRRLTTLGLGGLSRERAGLEVRDVHHSHYGRLCPIQTPEGPNIGLISNLATYAKIDQYGFLRTPYRKINNHQLTDEIIYLSAAEEDNYIIAQADTLVNKNNELAQDTIACRYHGDNLLVSRDDVDYMSISPKQIVSVSTACIPFMENDDANRVLMGANMQGQAVPLIKCESPYVGTGMESVVAHDSGIAIVCKNSGIVKYADSQRILVEHKKGFNEYFLDNFVRSNQGTVLSHICLVKKGDKVIKGQILADGPSMDKGELALGQNVTVAFSTWKGYNYEDALIISERLDIDDVFTSIHISEYKIERRKSKQGIEEITNEIPNVSAQAREHLDEDGIVLVGTEVKAGDILVGKVTPKGDVNLSPEDHLLHSIFGEKSKLVKNNSLFLPNGGDGIVQSVKRYSSKNYDLPPNVLELIKVFIVQKRKIHEGDKMAGRHGNKGVISIVLPVEDMPHTLDGKPVDILLNPLGVPSRMNIGQVLEIHLGSAAKNKGTKISIPVFESLNDNELKNIMIENNVKNFGKQLLIDGRSGEAFDSKISTGIMYMLKLSHMADDKLHARNIGPYSLITQQPLGGKAQNGGQRFGEMEVWALEAYGATHTLREMLTIKSDDISGRINTYQSLLWDRPIPQPGLPESFNVLTREIRGLGFNINILDENSNPLSQDINFTNTKLVSFDDLSSKTSKDSFLGTIDEELESLYEKQPDSLNSNNPNESQSLKDELNDLALDLFQEKADKKASDLEKKKIKLQEKENKEQNNDK